MEQDYKYYLDLGITETNNGNYDKALTALDKALELKPQSALCYFSKAIAFYNKGDIESAYANYGKAIEIDNKMIDAYYNRALIILSDEKSDIIALQSALEDFNTAITLDTKFVDAYYYKAVTQKKLKDYNGALETLNKVLEIEPNAIYSKALKKLLLQKYIK